MAQVKKIAGKMVFGLDIGTRSIVGTVGYKKGEEFYCIAQRIKEHDTRAMLDGQIHDIAKVGQTITEVKEALEKAIGRKLSDVCIAAAGRVLKTKTVHETLEFSEAKEISAEDIYTLKSVAVQKAYDQFSKEESGATSFYCVGNTVIKYYMNDYQISNLEGHRANSIGADLIATFLPDDVIDGLYKAVEIAGLRVVNLTLEPIAAIQVAIPDKFRMLNLALIDVGAGTSDICITNDGSITAYGMIPSAGDGLTEAIAKHCLVDFGSAEKIKRQIGETEEITYEDIMGLPMTISSQEILQVLSEQIDNLATAAAEKILELNGDKPVSAVFVVGGGGKIPGYTDLVAQKLGIPKQRTAIRGKEVMGNIIFEEDIEKDSTLVTPLGICLNYYEQSNSFIIVTFNDQRIKLYDNDKLSVVDAALQADFSNEYLFPRRGKTLQFTVNKKARSMKGQLGEAAVITIGGKEANIYSAIHENDVIQVTKSTEGEPATMEIGDLPEFRDIISVQVQDKRFNLPKYAKVNGIFQSSYYSIQEGDDIEVLEYCTVEQLLEFMDMSIGENQEILVNHQIAGMETRIYENYLVDFRQKNEDVKENVSETDAIPADIVEPSQGNQDKVLSVIVNGESITMSGKDTYVFVDVFDWIAFDLSKPGGRSVVTKRNGKEAQYMEPLSENDVIEIYWEPNSRMS